MSMINMINLIALLPIIFSGSVFSKSALDGAPTVLENSRNLPRCSGNQSEWTNCFGFAQRAGYSIQGEFVNGKLNGKGLIKDLGQLLYGDFVSGRLQGRGELIYVDGTKYVGEFKEGLLDGRGYVLRPPVKHSGNPKISAEGAKWVGEFKSGKLHGLGVYTNAWQTQKLSGIWAHGKIVHRCEVSVLAVYNDLDIQSNCRYDDVISQSTKKNVDQPISETLRGSRFVWPTEGKIIRAFDVSRKGIDIAGQPGQPIVSIGDGTVLYAYTMRGFGNLVIIDHRDGLVSAYGHNKTMLVKEGQTIAKGQRIAEMGDTDAESVRLHFQIRQLGAAVDPLAFLPDQAGGMQIDSFVINSDRSNIDNGRTDASKGRQQSGEEWRQREQARNSQRMNLQVSNTMPNSDGNYTITIQTNSDTASLKLNGEELGGRADGIYVINRVARAGQDTKLDIVARDVYGNSDTKSIIVRRAIVDSKVAYAALNPAQVKRQAGRDAVAIIIGIADYKSLPKADFANDDARVFYDYAIRALGVKPENIKLLVDGDAEEVEIIKAFRTWLPSKVRSSTDVYVYYSGHGLPTQDGQGLYLLPPRADRDFIARTSIQFQEINSDIQATKPKSVTIFMDACYSGQARTGETLIASARPVVLKSDKKLFPDNFTVIAASQSDQISSSSPDLKHGIFSYYLMKGMEGEADTNKDGRITLGEMQAYLVENVGRQAGMMSRKQEPQLIGNSNQILVGK